jgi:ABC-type bacteriocin/lantibiotic exporter with double-glycine peptidase domain
MAQLSSFIEGLPDGLDSKVGESGIMLSGGQRQRIGIARALYNNPEILVFDEATSSLDKDTEKEVMKSIYKLVGQKTILIVAHRLSTLDKCDTIYNLESGKLVKG